MKLGTIAVAAGALVLGPSLAPGQNPTPPPGQSGSVIRTETKVVLVDAVVTDKKGNYIRDLTANNFKVYEDNKEQTVTSFSFEADGKGPTNSQRRYMVLFFDNSTMSMGEQAQARAAAAKFVDSNAGPGRPMAIVNFTGGVQVAQNFTEDADRLRAVVKGVKVSTTSPNADPSLGPLSASYADFGARDMIMALRSFAKNLATVPGRKTLVLLSSGFPLNNDQLIEVKATIDACNRANVAIYPIDVRGLVAPAMGAQGMIFAPTLRDWNFHVEPAGFQRAPPGGSPGGSPGGGGGPGRSPSPSPSPGGGRPGGNGPPVSNNPGGNSGNAGRGNIGRGGGGNVNPNMNPALNPMLNPNRSNLLIPKIPDSAATNQQILYMLADGTGGFVILNTNDLLGGLEKIGKELSEYYLLGYTPPESKEGACHELRVKVEHSGGAQVRSRNAYCDAKPRDLLAGEPIEKQLETRAAAVDGGNTKASFEAPFFYSSANVARVNVAMDIDANTMKFDKEKGKFHGSLNLIGIAYRPDGSVAARFSDTMKRTFENKKEMEEGKDEPLHYENQFDIGPGQYNLKIAFSAGGDSFGKVEKALKIEPYDGSQFIVSSVVLTRRVRRIGEANASIDDSLLLEDRRPLIAQGVQFAPPGAFRFKPTDKPVIYFEVYEPILINMQDDKPPAVALQIRVLDRASGAQKGDTGPFRLDMPLKAGNPAIPIGLKLPNDSYPTGAYRLEIRAFDGAGNTFTRMADFDIE